MIRVDRYSPEWVLGIVEKLDDGYSGAEAVACGRRGTEPRGGRVRAQGGRARDARGGPGAAGGRVAVRRGREHREHAAEHRRYAGYLRTLACAVEKLRGEYIAIAGLLR